MSARRAPCPRRPASESARSRRARRAPRTARRRAPRAVAPTGGCRASRAAPRTSRAQLLEERIALYLVAERRRRAVAGVDDRVRRKALDERPDRREQLVPVAAGQVGAPDRAREQDVAREQRAVGVVGEVPG